MAQSIDILEDIVRNHLTTMSDFKLNNYLTDARRGMKQAERMNNVDMYKRYQAVVRELSRMVEGKY